MAVIIGLSSEIKMYIYVTCMHKNSWYGEFIKIVGMEVKNNPLAFVPMTVCCNIEN